jgi:hypothetical protein
VTEETNIPEEEVGEISPDSPQGNDSLVISELRTQMESLQTEKATLESRLGDQARIHGQEKREIVTKWQEWADNTSAYYDEKIRQLSDDVTRLEAQLVDALPSEGAKQVLENRREREDRERRDMEERRAQQEQATRARQSISAEIAKAAAELDVPESELVSASSVEEVWRLASRVGRQRSQVALEQRFKELQESLQQPQREEREEQERGSRVPGATADRTPPPTRRETREETAVVAGLRQLEEQLTQAKKRFDMASTAHLIGTIQAYKREHGL